MSKNGGVKHRAVMPSKRQALDKSSKLGQMMGELEHLKARMLAKVGHLFRVIKRQFGHTKVRYRGLMKNPAAAHAVCLVEPVDGVNSELFRGPSSPCASGKRRLKTADTVSF